MEQKEKILCTVAADIVREKLERDIGMIAMIISRLNNISMESNYITIHTAMTQLLLDDKIIIKTKI